MLMLETGAINR